MTLQIGFYHHIHQDGTQSWWLNNQLHREDGPAIIYPDGTEVWYLKGTRHREHGPAFIRLDGTKEWWQNGIFQKRELPKPTKVNWKTEGF